MMENKVTYEYDCGTYKDGKCCFKSRIIVKLIQGEDNTAPTISANDVTLNVGDTLTHWQM